MDNQKALQYWTQKSRANVTPLTAKVRSTNDFSQMDADFICRFVDQNSDLLDLATGTGITLNKYSDRVKSVVAVERYAEFTQFIEKRPNVEIVVSDITDFETTRKFDVINFFGIIQYFNRDEAARLYSKYKAFLKPNGKFLIKNQFGVREDVLVDGFSEELQCNYYSEYRTLDTETAILKRAGFSHFEVVDIYPPEFNRWENTHFYALIVE
ncbi:MAG: class I SAM-dependent methyltransferase [Thermoguttaceae bacterium]|nr:class I SAM-dependent methyltransferase [Thermoguttaceae bacterium]